ncbi:hypothetical protein PCASD_01616 [Puccinia coronata f. sp. avenae]|uniref:Uncharacterized protein n=1 Tax=Puccinia coronata f. sp. avenae TaxID=200324 RepID=A0A2N5VIU7_9BASI|nr:hypothetical protein PCASD_01616 [Puccinia coronata f. sp. avenae]
MACLAKQNRVAGNIKTLSVDQFFQWRRYLLPTFPLPLDTHIPSSSSGSPLENTAQSQKRGWRSTGLVMVSTSVILLLLILQVEGLGAEPSSPEERIRNQLASGKPASYLRRRQYPVRGPSPEITIPLRTTPPPEQFRSPPEKLRSRDEIDQDELGSDFSTLMAKVNDNLEGITNFGSDISDIKDGSNRVIRLIPQIDKLRKELAATAPGQNPQKLQKINRLANKAGKRLTRSMKAILKNPSDANIIRKEYRRMRESFKIITNAFRQTSLAALGQSVLDQDRIQESIAQGRLIGLREKSVQPGSGGKGKLTNKAFKDTFSNQGKRVGLKEKKQDTTPEEGKPKKKASKEVKEKPKESKSQEEQGKDRTTTSAAKKKEVHFEVEPDNKKKSQSQS